MHKTDIIFQELKPEDTDFLNQTEALFLDLHTHLKPMGLTLDLIENGEKIWMTSVKNTLGKFSILVVAIYNNEVIGFGFGALKFLPAYLGGEMIGHTTHMFVKESFRNMKIGYQLYEMLFNWFLMKNVKNIETQIAGINPEVERFLKSIGFKYEFLQLRKFF